MALRLPPGRRCGSLGRRSLFTSDVARMAGGQAPWLLTRTHGLLTRTPEPLTRTPELLTRTPSRALESDTGPGARDTVTPFTSGPSGLI